MTMIRTLAGAIVGVGLGLGFMLLMGMFTGIESLWPVVIVGILSGLSMRTLAKDDRNVYLKGGLAAVAVLVAVVGGKFALAALVQGPEPAENIPSLTADRRTTQESASSDTTPAGQEPMASSESAAGREAASLSDNEPGQLAVKASGPITTTGGESVGSVSSPFGRDLSLFDGIWLTVGALVAYQLGKREQSESKPSAAEDDSVDEPSTSTSQD